MKTLLCSALLATLIVGTMFAAPPRPKITGVAHISLAVHDIAAARAFYEDFLGYREAFKLDNPDGTLALAFIKVNDRQTLAELKSRQAHANYTRPMEARTGINRKRQLNLFDSDGTRTEVMEPKTLDGVPASPATAAPPR